MNHSEEHYQRREKFLKDKVSDQIKLERGEWIMSKKEALASFLGIDKLAELNRQPAYWPMDQGPTLDEWDTNLVIFEYSASGGDVDLAKKNLMELFKEEENG